MLKRAFFIVIAVFLFMGGCGYHLKGMGSSLPEKYKTIAILPVENKSFQADLGPILDSVIAEEFSRTQRLRLLGELEADLVLTTTITKYTDSPASFSATDKAMNYRIQVVVDSLLVARKEKTVIWKGRGLRETSDYAVVPGEIASAENSRRAATEKLLGDLAERIHDSVFEGF